MGRCCASFVYVACLVIGLLRGLGCYSCFVVCSVGLVVWPFGSWGAFGESVVGVAVAVVAAAYPENIQRNILVNRKKSK